MIYFDNAATTRVDKDVLNEIDRINDLTYANPAAMHRFGFNVEQEVKNATSYIASIMNADEKEIIWTSGASESNNLAIKGYVDAYKRKGNHIITTYIEHPSVLKVYEYLENSGFEVTYINVDSTGHVHIEDIINSQKDDTILVSIMYVNNIVGSVQDIEKIGNAIKKKNINCAFHVDAVQAFGKYKIDVKKSKIDFLSVSSHKFHGPKGVGILYKNKNIRVVSQILGGGQQDNIRSGTLNVPGIVGTYKAAKNIYGNQDAYFSKLLDLRNYLIDELNKINEKYHIITIHTKNDTSFAPQIVSVSFKGIRAEVMLHALEEKEIYVSAGSACSSHDKKTSGTLLNMGLDSKIAESTIRVSFGKYNEKSEIDEFIKALDIIIPQLLI